VKADHFCIIYICFTRWWIISWLHNESCH